MDVVAQAEAADLLSSAYETRVPIEPLTEKYNGLMLGDAYEIQLLQIRRRVTSGARVQGHKVGLTSAAMQRQMGVSQPDYGHLLDDMFWLEHQPIPVSRFLQPRVEPEVALVLKRPLRGRASRSPRRWLRSTSSCPRWNSLTRGSGTGGSGCSTPSRTTRDLGRRGLAIEPGWIVLTGGMTDAVFVTPGSTVAVHFTHLGSIFLSGG